MKKTIFILLATLLLLTGCENTSDITDQVVNVAQMLDENVVSVKNGTNSNYPDITYGEAFEAFFAQPAWKYFEGTQEGEDIDGDGAPDTEAKTVDVVEFAGYCIYQDVEVKALIQFILDKDAGTFSAEYLSFNEVPQNMLVLGALIDKAFETAAAGNEETSVSTESVDSSKNLIGTFTQVGLYDHEAYAYLDPEYIPTIYLYDDYTFEFHCNFYEGMKVYEGSWQVTEDDVSADYRFMVENEPTLPNLEFYLAYNKSRCDADFLTDYTLDAPFGMTSIDEVLFHPNFN
ncbi:MAG: hypothetical protein ACI4XJ_09330 [Eubacteriales bacterium]